jgi:hypothetical protein
MRKLAEGPCKVHIDVKSTDEINRGFAGPQPLPPEMIAISQLGKCTKKG